MFQVRSRCLDYVITVLGMSPDLNQHLLEIIILNDFSNFKTDSQIENDNEIKIIVPFNEFVQIKFFHLFNFENLMKNIKNIKNNNNKKKD